MICNVSEHKPMSLDEAFEIMVAFLEADKVLKNERDTHKTHGPEDYSKFSTNDLKSEFQARRKLSQDDKNSREEEYRYNHGVNIGGHKVADPTTYGASNRTKGQRIGEELSRRGVNPKELNTYNKKGDLDKKTVKEACELILSALEEGGEDILNEGIFGGNSERDDIIKATKKTLNRFFQDNGISDASLSGIGAKGMKEFKKGTGNELRFFISSVSYDAGYGSMATLNKVRGDCCKVIAQNKSDLKKAIKDATGKNVSDVYTEKSGINWICAVIEFNF